jgi:lipopolysaccharide transport system ATP-binding protein
VPDITIEVRKISKRYRIGQKEGQRGATLVGSALETLRRPFRNLRNLSRLSRFEDGDEATDVVWAVRDVSFDVRQGEVVGLIGRNGAGKSTLLKLLARIATPTSGRATIHGTVSSLLEVGTGFHPELTGRDNVYLNGAILGMTRREISRKFDEIVEFSGVERFIDTPVKRYSTGMKVRLAFSVAAHLEPDILLVDEVLSVGDAAFQKKCLGKMDDVARRGRTVIFVSHNQGAVTRLCERILLLENGGLVEDGPAHEVMSTYLRDGTGSLAEIAWDDPATAPGGEFARLRAVRVLDEEARPLESVDIRRPFRLEMEYEVLQGGREFLPTFRLWNAEEGVIAFPTLDIDPEWRGRKRPEGVYRSSAWVPGNLLAEGMFTVDVFAMTMNPRIAQFTVEGAVAFHVVDTMDGTSARGDWGGKLGGIVRPKLRWTTEYEGAAPEARSLAPEERVV